MNRNIAVVYEQGILRPLRPLNLPEHTRLEIRIIETGENKMTDAEKAYRALVQANLIRPSTPVTIEPLSDQERLQAANDYGAAGALSDWLIAERDNV